MPVSQSVSAELDVVADGKMPSGGESGVIATVSQSYRGPVPLASEMRGYKEVNPSFPERIMRMAEQEQEHRHAMQKRKQSEVSELKKSGQTKAFYSLLIILGVVLVIVWRGETVVAAILAGATIVGVVGMFIAGRWFESKNQSETEKLVSKLASAIKALPMKENEADS